MHRIEIADRARDDADAAYDWMVENISPAFAERWRQELFKQIDSLARRPARCPVAAESRKFPEQIRELTPGGRRKHTDRILFAIRDDAAAILYIRHGSRKEVDP